LDDLAVKVLTLTIKDNYPVASSKAENMRGVMCFSAG
jgi:hypothetical protein